MRGAVLEKKLMAMCDHPFVGKLLNTYRDDARLYMLLEFFPGGNLCDVPTRSRRGGVTATRLCAWFAYVIRMRRAFELGKTFRVGESVTTGRKHQTVWAGIHHKTQKTGGAAEHGYPDATYLDRVSDELAAAGVAADDAPLPVVTVLGVE